MPHHGDCGLDVATGTGDLAIELAKACDDVIGVDTCLEMLEMGREKLSAAGLDGRVKLIPGDALALPFEDNHFDCATTGFAMRNVVDIRQAFAEMCRVVKPGGQVVCLEAARPSGKFGRLVHHIYFDRVVPLIGWLVSGHRDAYSYLPNNAYLPHAIEIEYFPDLVGQEIHFVSHSLLTKTPEVGKIAPDLRSGHSHSLRQFCRRNRRLTFGLEPIKVAGVQGQTPNNNVWYLVLRHLIPLRGSDVVDSGQYLRLLI